LRGPALSIMTSIPLSPLSPAALSFEDDYARARRQARLQWVVGLAVFAVLFALSSWATGFFKYTQMTMTDGSRQWGWVIPAGIPRLGEFIEKMIPELHWATLGQDIASWFWRLDTWIWLLLETILIAFMATVLAVFGALILAFPAARNLSPRPWLMWITRRYLEICRTVPDLVWALIFVYCFSVGPLAGVLAIATHATGALGKLYSEAIENIDMRPLDGVKASGGSWFDQCRYGAMPQVLPSVLSYTLLRFEFNVRSSSIIGYVGAGGLGQEFRIAMSFQEYTDLSALFVITLVTVVIIDFVSEKLRHRVIGMDRT
jgi:phosphonate transport system permease protein